MKENEVGRACGTHARGKKNVQGFWWENPRERPLETPRRRWKNGIRMDLMETGWGGGVWSGFTWLRIGTSGGLWWMRWWTSGLWRHGVSYIQNWKPACKYYVKLTKTIISAEHMCRLAREDVARWSLYSSLRNWKFLSCSRKYPSCVEPEDALPCTQVCHLV
jgi:hypothetical protein